MAIVVGIDEAGLGPVLGPLVVSAAAFSLPDELIDVPMWDLLAGAVARKVSRRSGAIAIDDSKKLYTSKKAGGLHHLERGVLAMLTAADRQAGSLRQLLQTVSPEALDELAGYPWYVQADMPLPTAGGATDVLLAGNAVRAAMDEAGMKMIGMRSEVVFAGQFNRLLDATGNKATATFGVTCRLIARALQRTAGRRVLVCVDFQGGRRHYLPALQRAFDGATFKVLQESDTLCVYRIDWQGRQAEVRFAVGAEKNHLPVALASMLSKYVRELFMSAFNEFWAGHVPALKRTAGYYVDGRRFYQDIQPALRRLDIDESLIYRNK